MKYSPFIFGMNIGTVIEQMLHHSKSVISSGKV